MQPDNTIVGSNFTLSRNGKHGRHNGSWMTHLCVHNFNSPFLFVCLFLFDFRLLTQGNADARIVMNAMETGPARSLPDVRLVDGPTPLSGRLQIHHLGEWRSVCTNSRKWVELGRGFKKIIISSRMLLLLFIHKHNSLPFFYFIHPPPQP